MTKLRLIVILSLAFSTVDTQETLASFFMNMTERERQE